VSGKDSAPANGGPLVRLDGLHKVYALDGLDVHAVRGVSLEVEAGEYVAIMGASGSGKSTLMNLIGCLDTPTKGTISLAGRDVSRLNTHELAGVRNRLVGFVFQGFNLLARATALENVELPMIYLGLPAKKRRQQAIETLEAVGLGDRMQHLPSQLSGGQQQRVAIARALVNNPLLILADEPTGNLDSRTSVEVMSVFQRLNRTRRITMIMVTHEQELAQYANRVLVMRDGRVVADRPVAQPRDAAQQLANWPAEPEDEFDPLRAGADAPKLEGTGS
jgi:putative ABC transport system ATP-binding protein